MIDAQIKEDMMREEVVVAHLLGAASDFGDDTGAGPQIQVDAYIERTNQLVTTPRGEKVNSDTFLILDADDFDIDEDEHTEGLFEFVWLPRANRTSQEEARRPKRVTRCSGEFGTTSHWEIFL